MRWHSGCMLREIRSHNVAKNSQALWRVMWPGNIPNAADFVASYKIYTVFHVSGCFKLRVTCVPFIMSSWCWYQYQFEMVLWNIKTEKTYNHCWHQNMLNWILLYKTELNSIIRWLVKTQQSYFSCANICNLMLLFFL